jgi:hypothetical protein
MVSCCVLSRKKKNEIVKLTPVQVLIPLQPQDH